MPDDSTKADAAAKTVAAAVELATAIESERCEYAFRRKDLADVESILQSQRENLDRAWIEERLIEMFGERNPRIPPWRELVAENPSSH